MYIKILNKARSLMLTKMQKLLLPLITVSITLLTLSSLSTASASPTADIQVIEAYNSGPGDISGKLKFIAPRLKSTFKQYKGFKALKEYKVNLAQKRVHTIEVADGLKVGLTLVKLKDRNIELEVSGPKRGRKHRVKARLGRLFFEAIKHRGRVLLLAIRPSI